MASGLDVTTWARHAQDCGVGEIMITSIDREGSRIGYDTALVEHVAATVAVPVIAHGGAKNRADLAEVVARPAPRLLQPAASSSFRTGARAC